MKELNEDKGEVETSARSHLTQRHSSKRGTLTHSESVLKTVSQLTGRKMTLRSSDALPFIPDVE